MRLSRSGNVRTLEGEPLEMSLIAIMQFPTAQHPMDFVKDPDYAPLVRGTGRRAVKVVSS
jgi:uncharacterized protein (DUF1330 family)